MDQLANSEFIKRRSVDDFSVADLKKLKSDDFDTFAKKIQQLSAKYLKTVEKLPNEEVFRFEQSEVKKLTTTLSDFHSECQKNGLSVRELEKESIKFITDKYKRFFFESKWAQRIYIYK